MSAAPKRPSHEEIALSMKHLKENLPAFLEVAEVRAQIQRRYYQELVKSGFSEEQALKLAGGQGVLPL